MSQREFQQMVESLDMLSQEQMQQLLRELEGKLAGEPNTGPGMGEERLARQVLQQRLFDAGIVSEIKPPIADFSIYRNRRAVPIQGEPLSETVIRERR